MTEDNRQQKIYKNMQHAIVEALHVLGESSQYNDGSVRMKDLFTFVEKSPIEINGQIDSGPHRFSIFNSALSGRRSAAILFEKIDNNDRQGAWWKLAKPYDECLQIALEQKGNKKAQKRNRPKVEPKPTSEITHVKPQVLFKWNKSEVMDIFEQIKELTIKTANLREENRKLKEKLVIENEEIDLRISSIYEQDPNSPALKRLDEYQKAKNYELSLRGQLETEQKKLFTLSDQAMENHS
ncbi:hypothetical protein TVAG_459050 [Trichomonas vaginalis G3]|uniref:Uncharacterized protein n=1 Tax=Trichomonas vaginalis (strain ATCC PRA-98 / G3) TaxID=412133 RepID=A2E6B0_TRIV3|nr:hypothetical protein TVAGG3_0394700 [Trichomonas vaginalis G3]EAY11833.1 hypothetical protein TVAG_459050 [Trichomonas vaginalis G3]KAI5534251.1 hypothetical protein TVAGG3_0394700 [Trichomonas vaginalis G3]|eukprot:XP_001324056.1 hypothetical protein [Trichomonas vaginalis G3]